VPTCASTHSWFNGEIVEREAGAPSVASVSFHLGTGVFDGLMAYWNQDHYYLHCAEEHLLRFKAGAQRMGLQFRWTVSEMLTAIEELLDREARTTQYIRPIAYRRAPELWVTGSQDREADVSIFSVVAPRDISDSLNCQLSPVERVSSRALPQHTKVSGAYVNSFMARRCAELAGFHDGIMLDREGRLAEASAANVFLIRKGCLITPPANPDVFPGITRTVVQQLAGDLGIPVSEQDVRPSDLPGIDGAFLCSTLMEIRPLAKIDDRDLPTAEDAAYTAILRSFRSLVHQ